jgi:polyhydroxyalkanoate synthesis repressor PhaR
MAQQPDGRKPGAEGEKPPVVVKKYANRRLYNTEASTYVTLEDLAQMVRNGRDFVVYDAKSGDDITRSVLTQIIVEEESKGQHLLPTTFLRQLIGLYGDNMGGLVPRYLEYTMSAFARQQEQVRKSVEQAMGGLMPFPQPFGNLEEMGKQNLAMMERAMSLFTPFGRREDAPPGAPGGMPPSASEVEDLRAEVARLREELAAAKRK